MSYFPTPPLSIVDLPAATSHFKVGRNGFSPRYIAIHHTGGTNSGPWLTYASKPAVSCHRLIAKNGTIYKVVKDEDTAFCAGFAVVGPVDPDTNDPAGVATNFNLCSLNIELENLGTGRDPYPLLQMQACAAQVTEWFGKYGVLALVGHGWVDARKNDPLGFDWPLLYQLILDRLRSL